MPIIEREFTAPDRRSWLAIRMGTGPSDAPGEGDAPQDIPTGLWFQCLGSEESRFHPIAVRTDLPTLKEFETIADEQLSRWWWAAVQIGGR